MKISSLIADAGGDVVVGSRLMVQRTWVHFQQPKKFSREPTILKFV